MITSLWRPDVWSFLPAYFPLMNEKTMKLSTCMWPHWERGWEEETGTDHQLQHTQWKSLIASHFRLKGKKEKGNDEESRVYVTRKMTQTTLRKIYIFFFPFLNTLQEGEERRGVAARCSQVGSSKGATFFGNITSIWVVKKMKCAKKKIKNYCQIM